MADLLIVKCNSIPLKRIFSYTSNQSFSGSLFSIKKLHCFRDYESWAFTEVTLCWIDYYKDNNKLSA